MKHEIKKVSELNVTLIKQPMGAVAAQGFTVGSKLQLLGQILPDGKFAPNK